MTLRASPSATPPSGPIALWFRLWKGGGIDYCQHVVWSLFVTDPNRNACHACRSRNGRNGTYFRVCSVLLTLRASPSATPSSGPIALYVRLWKGGGIIDCQHVVWSVVLTAPNGKASFACHSRNGRSGTYTSVCSVLLTLRASPSATPPSGPILFMNRLWKGGGMYCS